MLSSGSCSWVRGGVLGETDRPGSPGGLPSPVDAAPLLLAARNVFSGLRVPLLLLLLPNPCALLLRQPRVGAGASLLLQPCHAGRALRLALVGDGFVALACGWVAVSLLGARVEVAGIMQSGRRQGPVEREAEEEEEGPRRAAMVRAKRDLPTAVLVNLRRMVCRGIGGRLAAEASERLYTAQ